MKILKSSYSCVFAVVLLILLSNAFVRAQSVDSRFDEYMNAMVRLGRFNGYVLIARDGKAVFSKGYGMANFEYDVPNTAQTKFRIASLTKSFTAMAVMMLREQGKLSLQDSVCKYVSDCPEIWKAVTIRHLLNHTSGISDYSQLPGFMRTISVRVTKEELIASVRDKPLLFALGEKFSYSNSNYFLLGEIIERVSGQPYGRFVQENIFVPLRMMNSGYDDNSTVLKGRAVGYTKEGDVIINARYRDMSNSFSCGALYSTAEDLLLWNQALYTDKLASKQSLGEIFEPGKGDVGYGWFIQRELNRKLITQSGFTPGFAAQVFRYPDDKVCIILLNNFENGAPHLWRTGRDLAAILFGEKYALQRERIAIKVDTRIYDAYVGEYRFESNRILFITKEGDKLFAQPAGRPKGEIFPESETIFFYPFTDVEFEFIKNETGKVGGMIFRQGGGQEFKGNKVK
jgi:CubicO group peptidase (beta-lactamase class C family)